LEIDGRKDLQPQPVEEIVKLEMMEVRTAAITKWPSCSTGFNEQNCQKYGHAELSKANQPV
jgi:hypothetical protein